MAIEILTPTTEGVFIHKGDVATFSNLPLPNTVAIGDIYRTLDTMKFYINLEEGWVDLNSQQAAVIIISNTFPYQDSTSNQDFILTSAATAILSAAIESTDTISILQKDEYTYNNNTFHINSPLITGEILQITFLSSI